MALPRFWFIKELYHLISKFLEDFHSTEERGSIEFTSNAVHNSLDIQQKRKFSRKIFASIKISRQISSGKVLNNFV